MPSIFSRKAQAKKVIAMIQVNDDGVLGQNDKSGKKKKKKKSSSGYILKLTGLDDRLGWREREKSSKTPKILV